MTDEGMILEMLNMQRALDSAIYDGHCVFYDESKCRLALVDEIGEFNHEAKSQWCWWKKTQKPCDEDKLLEEFVDIVHFALSITYHKYDGIGVEYRYKINEMNYYHNHPLYKMYSDIIVDDIFLLEKLFCIGEKFGYDVKTVYDAYKKKNEVNYKRLANNY